MRKRRLISNRCTVRVARQLHNCSQTASKGLDCLDKFAKQAINRGRMNYLGRVGSDTGIRTRVSAVRGRRPGPLDDIANSRTGVHSARQLLIFPCPAEACKGTKYVKFV